MRQLLQIFFLCSCFISFGQNFLLNHAISWFSKTDRTTIDNYLKNSSYQFVSEKDSLDLNLFTYSLVKTENGTQPFIHILLGDSTLEFISIDTYSQGKQMIVSGLKSGRFKSIGTAINGNFITTTYDNGNFLIQEDYEAVANPLGKGEIAYFRYRIFRKYGQFDSMNGEKIRYTEEGLKIVENYKNGLLDGQRTIYFPNESIRRTENYRSGRLNGTASDYTPEGKLVHSTTHSYHWKYGLEKWYNNEGKLVKSLQWRRDIPTGVEKQTFNGVTIGSVSYINGSRQGPAKIPVYFDPHTEANYPLDTLNDAPLGIEDVAYDKGLKSGKAVCTYFNTTDTMYVAYYKAGQLDSTFSRYEQNGILLYTATFSNGLEHGKRIYRIPSGPLKDTVYRIEQYQNGKLNGPTTQYYQKAGPDQGIYAPETWEKVTRHENYTDDLLNGDFINQKDTENYTFQHYVNGFLAGKQEYSTVSDGKQFKTTGFYENGIKTGEWITEIPADHVILTEHYEGNKRHGDFRKTIKGFKSEERFYIHGMLQRLRCFERNSDYRLYTLDFTKNNDSVSVLSEIAANDTFCLKSYRFKIDENLWSDTILTTLVNSIENDPETTDQSLNGRFALKTSDYQKNGNYKNGKEVGKIGILHADAGVLESLIYENNSLISSYYTHKAISEDQPYSGKFISAITGEKISIKDGLRHGWCVEYDKSSGKEIRRTKYVKGMLKKAIERKPD